TISFIGALILLGETMRHRATGRLDPIAVIRTYAGLLRTRLFMAYSLTMGFATGTFQAFIAGSPIVLISLLKLPPDEFALYTLVWPLAYTVGNYLSSRFTIRLGIDRLLVIGNLVSLIAAAVMVGLAVAGVFTIAAIIG